jgi:general secretion pathway protein G
MKVQSIKKGFTLIELLVVITIIGILATGAVGVFTKQLQGARDSTRIKDLKLLETANNLYFSDNDVYPSASTGSVYRAAVSGYMSKDLQDPKTGNNTCWASSNSNQACQGAYDVFNDSFGLTDAAYKMGVYFEKEENYNNLAANTGSKGDG